jgi:hypothetical protein
MFKLQIVLIFSVRSCSMSTDNQPFTSKNLRTASQVQNTRLSHYLPDTTQAEPSYSAGDD